jgi:hypothetical protein
MQQMGPHLEATLVIENETSSGVEQNLPELVAFTCAVVRFDPPAACEGVYNQLI